MSILSQETKNKAYSSPHDTTDITTGPENIVIITKNDSEYRRKGRVEECDREVSAVLFLYFVILSRINSCNIEKCRWHGNRNHLELREDMTHCQSGREDWFR